MIFDATTHTLTLEREQCNYCNGEGSVATRVNCPTCGGTGRGPRGGRGGCRNCYEGKVYDQINRDVCPSCNGTPENASMESWCDYAPVEAIMAMTVRVSRQNREASWNEQYLGLNSLWSCSDYGDRWKRTDEAVLDEIMGQLRDRERVQAVKILPDGYDRTATMLPMASGLVILLTRGGYSVRADFANVEQLAAREPNYAQAHSIGMAVYNAGGNGTMVAASPILTTPNGD